MLEGQRGEEIARQPAEGAFSGEPAQCRSHVLGSRSEQLRQFPADDRRQRLDESADCASSPRSVLPSASIACRSTLSATAATRSLRPGWVGTLRPSSAKAFSKSPERAASGSYVSSQNAWSSAGSSRAADSDASAASALAPAMSPSGAPSPSNATTSFHLRVAVAANSCCSFGPTKGRTKPLEVKMATRLRTY